MTNDTEPRALGAALSAPAFVTRGHGVAMHAANRHVERWAPEASARRVGSMRSLGFVDRLVAPWMETAQRSASLRLFSQYAQSGASPREPGAVSWVFPRPWYQDELDWMAAARQSTAQAGATRPVTPTLLTTRGTYVSPATSEIAAPAMVMPSALYEYVAPSLSIAASQRPQIPGVGFGGETQARGEAYSSLVSLASVQAADLMTRAVAPLATQRRGAGATTAMTPGLRAVLTSILERAATSRGDEARPTRLSLSAPELVTPPAPKAQAEARSTTELAGGSPASASAVQVAEQYAAQRTHIVELQRTAQRELAAHAALATSQAANASLAGSTAAFAAASADPRAANDAAGAAQSEAIVRTARVAAAAEAAQTAETTQAAQAAEHRQSTQAATTQAAQVAAAELRATAERAESDLRQRTGAQRLHEQARAAAAAHARTPLEPAQRAGSATEAPTASYRAPAEMTAAVAGLPPELAAMLGAAMSQRPERAVQAINELNETLRTVELLARSSANGAAFEVTRGPRMMMPAGLGGLVNAIDRAQVITERPAMLGGARPLAPLAQFVAPEPQAAQAAQSRAVRMPQLSWLTAAPRAQGIAPTTALGATATAAPAALSHVAWTDRWLARFAGAAPQSLDLITAMAGTAPALRMQALANAAPGAVFVAPDFERSFPRGELTAEQAAYVSAQARSGTAGSSMAPSSAAEPAAATGIPGMRLLNPAPSEPIRRFDDAAETPDDVFAAISQAASRGRGRSGGATTGLAAPASVAAAVAPAADRQTYADLVAHAAPSAPGPGLSAQLASSPFAPALRHVLPLPAAASFDVRSLFGAGLGATYLAGLLGAASHELQIGAQVAPAWAAWEHAPIGGQLGDSAERLDRMVPVFDAAYVSPDAFQGAGVNAAAEPQASPEARVALEAGDGRTVGEMPAASLTLAPGAAAFAASSDRGANVPLTTLRTALLSWGVMVSDDTAAHPGVPQLVPLSFATASQRDVTQSTSTARMMIDAMSMPMLGDAGPDLSSAWAAPGMVADRAQSWSVAQERSSSDLALDFVTPELVLAARVYGLGPAEVAQAARLAIVGPGQLGAMASAVDRTFVDAMAIVREARGSDAERRYRSSPPGAPGAARELAARDLVDSSAAPARAEIATAFPTSDGDIAAAIAPTTRVPMQLPPSGAAFGVDRRSPRGAFLWPQATVAALGMTAAGSDGQLSVSVAALELLAAQVVAEVGTYAALSEADAGARALAGEAEIGTGVEGGSERGVSAASRTTATATATAALPGVLIAGRDARDPASSAEPGEAEVLGAAGSFVPAARRARFDALYVALGQTTAGRSWSPAARAARALALAGRGDDSAVTARERAATAWDVLPVVYPGHGDTTSDGAGSVAAAAVMASSYVAPGVSDNLDGAGMRTTGGARSTGSQSGAMSSAQRGGARLPSGTREVAGFAMTGLDIAAERPYVTVSPSLAGLSARAGDALGSYVSPVAPPSAPVARERREPSSVGAVLRPPTAAQEYVQTGRSGGRYGGNEVEIPPWFEAAARKMFSDRSDNADGISLAELTLVTAAPASHIAASTRSAPSAASPSPSAAGAGQPVAAQIDVDKLANDVYREILVMMDVARARNGEPYL